MYKILFALYMGTSGNEARTQNECPRVPIGIASYSYTVIVPCTVLYDVLS